MTRAMKYSGIEWIREIPANWDFDKGKYHFTNNKYVVGIKSANYDRLALTMNGVIHRNKEDNEGLQPSDFNTYQLLKKNELVFKLIDLQNVSTSRIGLAHDTGIVSPAYVILHANNDINPSFAEKFFLMMWYREIFNALGDAGVRSNLNAGDLLNVRIPVPPIDEQNKIADYLDKKCEEIDAITAEIQEQISTLEEYKKSVISETVTKGLNPNATMKDSGIEWIGKIPEHWDTIKIGHLFSIRNERNTLPEDKVQLLSLYTDIGVFPQGEHTTASGNHAQTVDGYKIVRKNDIVVNIILAWMGAIGISDYNGVTSPAYDVYIPNISKAFPHFYHYVFRTKGIAAECYKYGRGIMLMRWRTYSQEFKQIKIPYPDIKEQKEIAKYLDAKCKEIESAIEDKQKQIETLEEYKKTLIYEYVTGKKEVA